jgi:putative nucleotidyltransferase with HDIG domain
MALFKKSSPRREKVRKSLSAERLDRVSRWLNADIISSIFIWIVFVAACGFLLTIDILVGGNVRRAFALLGVILTASVGGALYCKHYQGRLIRNHTRAIVLGTLFLLLLMATKIGVLSAQDRLWASSWATGMTVMVAIVLTIVYDQRFALGMGLFFAFLACLATYSMDAGPQPLVGLELMVILTAGVFTCCFSLGEIRTRMKLLEVSALTAAVMFAVSFCAAVLSDMPAPLTWRQLYRVSAYHAGFSFLVGLFVQSFLPVIERVFRVATSMTLLDYSDANQPLLKKLAMEAPGTYTHSLMIGSIAEAGAEAIGANGLLCRVGAYYHDIGKINKPTYFTENELGGGSRHKELSPTMSLLVIIGHVKDGVEMAKAYKLPAVIRQFIETHHGTTLIEPFYHAAVEQYELQRAEGEAKDTPPPSQDEFRYAGPKPRTKEAAILMLGDAVEGAIRSLAEVSPSKVETVVHNIAMKRLQDGQFDECDITLRELSRVQAAMAKTIAAHYHGRVAYPSAPDEPTPPADPPAAREKRPKVASVERS